MEEFKVRYPAGYTNNVKDITNDNMDINVVFSNGTVHFATIFTIKNIQELMSKDNGLYFWAMDMVIVIDLERNTIRKAIGDMIKDGYFYEMFSSIGTIESVYPDKNYTFSDIIEN